MRTAPTACLALIALVFHVSNASDWGIVNLDNSTFPRLIDGSRAVFVRFDREVRNAQHLLPAVWLFVLQYPYGEKHDAWKAMAAAVAGSNADVLIANVGISTYGDKMNQDLAQKYGYKDSGKDLEYNDMDKFPKFKLVRPRLAGYAGHVA